MERTEHEVERVVVAKGDDVAVASSPQRVSLLDLAHLDRPPVVLEGSAAIIWKAIDGERDLEGVVAAVADEVFVEADVVRDDVLTFIDQLLGLGLLRRR
ncbi:PqqD family protein [Nocardioides sp.]|uniref:PqqD family protein n=1 Tax=Nocardioides sp. TaxID=35761 RepID=UPI003511E912